jgi:hypothetical protein
MAGREQEEPQRGRFRPVMLVFGTLLAVAATGTLVLTDNPRVLRLAVVVALWAFVLGAMAGARRQPAAEAGGGPTRREIELRRAYEIELEREVAARREYELQVEVEIRRELESGLHQRVDALRQEVTELRRDVVDRVAGDLRLERIAWHGESTRLTGGPPGSHGFDTGGTPAIAGKVAEPNGRPAPGLDRSPPLRREPPVGPRPSPAQPPARGVPRPASYQPPAQPPSPRAASYQPPAQPPSPRAAPHQPPAPSPLRAEVPPTPPVRPDPLSDPLPPEALLPLASLGQTGLDPDTGELAWPPTPATAPPARDQSPPYPGQADVPAAGRHAQREAAGLGSGVARHGAASHARPSHGAASHGAASHARPSHGAPDQLAPNASQTGPVAPPRGSRRRRYREDGEENEVLSRALRER